MHCNIIICCIIIINNDIDIDINIHINLREVGALPDYSSREGCGVEVQESCEEAAREFGRLADV